MEPRPAPLERLATLGRWAGQELPAALEARPAPRSWKAPAPVERRQPGVAQAEAVLG
jgi:hypothetical protein